MVTVAGFLSPQQTFCRHSADRSEAGSLVRIDWEVSPGIQEPIRAIAEAQLLRLGGAKERSELVQGMVYKAGTSHLRNYRDFS